ncbi:MAG TPA: hypothetical protein VFK33_10590 [Bacillales bacterium]|nr:hypothetical protein [Bacillales bacterium]
MKESKKKDSGIKVILIFLFTMAGMFMLNFLIDLFLDTDLAIAVEDLYNPFWVMEPIGYMLIIVLVLWVFFSPLKSRLKRRR